MKLGLIYYKNLLDSAVEKMFSSMESMFTRDDNSNYVFSSGWSEAKISKLFEKCLRESMLEVLAPSDETYDKHIVISSCWPKDNLLLKMRDSSYFPAKLDKLIHQMPNIKYILREKGICIDVSLMNKVFVSTFNKMLAGDYVVKLLGKKFSNVICASHSSLDCYAMFKVIKWAYGSSNCTNIWKDKMHDQVPHLVAVNELISKYVPKRACMNKSNELKEYAREVKQYLREKIGA